MHPALPERPAVCRIFDTTRGEPLEGIVRHKGLHDEQTGAAFMIVETARKEAHYVRLDRPMPSSWSWASACGSPPSRADG